MTMIPAHREPHPLAAFKPRAVVDWVTLRFTTATATQHRHLRASLPPGWRAFAKPIGENARSCREWRLTIQDPPTAPAIARVLRGQGVDPGSVRVEAIEVAIDWLPSTHEARTELANAAHHLARHLARPPVGTPRITEPGHYRAAARPHDTLQALSDGWTVNIGGKDADHRTRLYVKRQDSTQTGAYQDLPEAHHRARIEVTLSGQAAPVTTLHDLAALRFETLARHFHQRAPTIPSTPFAAMLRPEVQQWGRPDDAAKRTSHRRQNHVATMADTIMNRRIYDALRGLTRASQRAGISESPRSLDDYLSE